MMKNSKRLFLFFMYRVLRVLYKTQIFSYFVYSTGVSGARWGKGFLEFGGKRFKTHVC